MYPVRRESKGKRGDYAITLPLESFVDEWLDDESSEPILTRREEESSQADYELTLIEYFSDEIE